jgi:hypothetical protein
MNAADLQKLLDAATPGRRVRFHGTFCKEAQDTPFTEWDSSHQTSVILPNGERYRGYATHKHANDAALDGMAPDLARRVIAAEKLAEALRFYRMNVTPGFPFDDAHVKADAALAEWEAAP